MGNKEVIMVFADGSAKAIYSDELMPIIRTLGPFSVRRVSTVEWEGGEAGGWAVRAETNPELAIRLNKDGQQVVSTEGSIVLFPTRNEALDREVELFWELSN